MPYVSVPGQVGRPVKSSISFYHVDRRPRKRAKLAWEFPQTHFKAYSVRSNGQEFPNMTSFGAIRILPDHASLSVKGLSEKGSPPWRDDDKDGHYMFALGDNLNLDLLLNQ